MENVRVPFSLVANSEGGETREVWVPPLSTALLPERRQTVREGEEKLLEILPQPSEEIQRGKEGSGPMERGPSFSIYCQRANPGNINVNRAQTSYTLNNRKYTLQGEVGQEKPDFVCTAEYFL